MIEAYRQEPVPIVEHLETRPIHDPLRFIDTNRHESVDLFHYTRVIRKHLYLILLFVGTALLFGATYLTVAIPIYTANATLLVTAPEPDLVQAKGPAVEDGETVATPDYYKTQCDILKSRSLAERVVRELGLFGAAAQSSASVPPEPSRILDRAVDAYLGRLVIKPMNEASLVSVEFNSPDPVLAAKVANIHASEFIEERLELRRQRKESVADLLQAKLFDLKSRLETSERALNDYRRDHGIIPGLMSLNGKDAIVIDRLTQLSKELTGAQVKRIELESQVELIHKGQSASLPMVVANTTIQGLQREVDDLYGQERTLSSRFTPGYPAVENLDAKIRGIQNQIDTEISREVNSTELAYKAALKDETDIATEVSKQRSLTIALNDAGVKYAMLQREVDANRDLYESILRAMKDFRVAADSQASNVAIVDRAEVPETPSRPRKVLVMGLAAVFGLFGGLGVAFFLDYLGDPLEDPEDVARVLRLPALAVIPRLPPTSAAGMINNSSTAKNGAVAASNYNSTNSWKARRYAAGDEAYRHLRTSLLLAQHNRNYVALITSSVPSEGKTRTAVTTSILLALNGKRVLLIDGDLRRPRCHQYLGVENNEGLACILSEARVPRSLIQSTEIGKLDFLSAGGFVSNPSDCLSSSNLDDFVESLRQTYEFIVIDSCPVVPLSDSLVLARVVDGVALIVDSSRTSKRTVRRACSLLSHARANIIGIVLNKSSIDNAYYKRYYQHYLE
jgi:capsular exopolysaccharide synthesis family protein